MPTNKLFDSNQLLASLKSRATGLTHQEAKQRLHEYGPNQIQAVATRSKLRHFLAQFTQLFNLVLWAAAALAWLADWLDPSHDMAKLAITLVVVILISGLFSYWQEYRIEKTLALLATLLPEKAKVMRDGVLQILTADQLVPGDILILEQGNHIPADCYLLEAAEVRVNLATLTGESVPQQRSTYSGDNSNPQFNRSMLLAGTTMVAGQAKALVFATGMRTEFGKIAHLTQTGLEEISPLRREIGYLSRFILIMALVIGALFFVAGWILAIPIWQNILFSVGLIVAVVPEGLLPTLTLALVLATQRMAKRNVLVRYLPAVEALGSTTVICTDKTGTLTQNSMSVTHIYLDNTLFDTAKLTSSDNASLSRYYFSLVTRHCHDLKLTMLEGRLQYTGDPLELALVRLNEPGAPANSDLSRIAEIPFDVERRRLTTIHRTSDGNLVLCKGAPESVLPLCRHFIVQNTVQPLTNEYLRQITDIQNRLSDQGLRVLALAYNTQLTGIHPATAEQHLIFVGLVALHDPPRPEVPEAIARCRAAGIRVIMITGDHPHTASAIAHEIGLTQSTSPTVVTGDQLRQLTDTQLQLLLEESDLLFARIGPDQKRRIVDALKLKQHIVAVTGDGVNDAPALKSAHIGIAMGKSGSDVAREAADIILLDDNFASIVAAIEEGRTVFANIQKFLTYILAHNVPELIPYLAYALVGVPLALTPIQILSIDMGADSLTALGLGTERSDPRIMQQPPRPAHQHLLDYSLAWRAYIVLGLTEAIAAMTAFFVVLYAAGWQYGTALATTDPVYRQATTACLCSIVLMQIINVFLCRSQTQSVFTTRWFGNPLILWGVVVQILLLIVITQTAWGSDFFATTAIPSVLWQLIVPFILVMLLFDELGKWRGRHHNLPSSQK